MAEWHTAGSAAAWWPGAPTSVLDELLAVAREHIEEALTRCGMDVPVAGEVPNRYRLAQLREAQAVWSNMRTNPGGEDGQIGLDGMSVRRPGYVMGIDIHKIAGIPTGWIG